MLRTLIALVSGLIFSLGLVVSGMVSPSRVLAFLDITGACRDPSLALVLISAVGVSALGAAFGRRRKSPLPAPAFSGPAMLAGMGLFALVDRRAPSRGGA